MSNELELPKRDGNWKRGPQGELIDMDQEDAQEDLSNVEYDPPANEEEDDDFSFFNDSEEK